MRLKHVLTINFIVLAALPLLASLVYLNFTLSQNYRNQIEERILSLSLVKKGKIVSLVEGLSNEVSLIASGALLRSSLLNWNLSGDERSAPLIRKLITGARVTIGDIYNIAVYDSDGNYVSSILNEHGNKFNNVEGKAYPYFLVHQESAVPCLAVIMEIRVDGVGVGIIQVDYYLESLIYDLKDQNGLGKSGEWLFTIRADDGGALFVTPLKYDKDAAFKRSVSTNITQSPITQAMMGNEILMRNSIGYLGEKILASTRYISRLDWGLVAKINEDEVNALINSHNKNLYIIELFIVASSMFAGFLVSFFISRPLDRLKSYTSALRGGIDEKILSNGWTEIRQIAGDVGEISRFVRELKDDFNKKVAERTKELDAANLALKEMASRDPLTGLYNLRYFKEKLNYEHTRACRYKSNYILVAFDIDYFKKINDTWGHAAGDEVLICLSSFLNRSLRSTDLIARVGGEEFAILLPEQLDQGVRTFLERLRHDISMLEFDFNGHRHHITCSFGVATFCGDTRTPAEVIKKSDDALYQAKALGRNRVVYESSLDNVVDISRDLAKNSD
ncbi:sensor domain-containing diguanylate cyclase [Hahella sp. CR1]|uniref:sensor domain-containing diguanylate cyclase n=1 Tax=Hahella sp. CR1 TaxID=2992807 RepID=UPI002442DBBE|nr:sensor domain-containing diguanylate cyclase [Hahella sp. CR1]MDG9670866.1 sensor domain-containing diguanylate cyclase [Hahella sp. CR1]